MEQDRNHKSFSDSYTRRDFISTSLKAGAAAFTTGLLPQVRAHAENRYNVLFIAVDDLRPLLGCYGHSNMHTPNIDRIAQRGTLFNRAYCQFPVCNPSRTSVLTGLRPNSTGVHSNTDDFLQTVPTAISLPHHFKIHGYHTHSIGKVAHGSAAWEDKQSWSVPIWRERWKGIDKGTSPSWNALDVQDDDLQDGRIAKTTVDVLAEIRNRSFFLAVGFNKPHLPFYAPSQYFDLYNLQDFDLPTDSTLPIDTPQIASNPKTLQAYEDISTAPPLSDEKTLELIRAYAANISYIDAQVGRILDQLDMLNLTEKTVIVFWGDHGFHLGEHGLWRKNTLFEVAVRSPLIVSIPGQSFPDRSTDSLVELIDIYPTLCNICQLPTPEEVEGISMTPLIEDPILPWKTAVFAQLRRTLRIVGSVDGYTMRTDQYRYTEWGKNGEHGVELYDYYNDPNETVNIAPQAENKDLVEQLSKRLQAGWKSALPEEVPGDFKPTTLIWDVNGDGIVDMQDLVLVSNNFGSENIVNPMFDVNKDGIVNIIDLLLIAAHLGETTNGSSPSTVTLHTSNIEQVEKWLIDAKKLNNTSEIVQDGVSKLEILLNSAHPKMTVLLPNYPNPFNPETWIPYDLHDDAHVIIHIYNINGETVRKLNIGYRTSGIYRTKSQAAYWDGKNSLGEQVSTGIYFYTITAQYARANGLLNQFKATRKMVIAK